MADAVRTPWVPVALYRHILGGKWVDWTASLGLEYRPVRPRRPLRRGGGRIVRQHRQHRQRPRAGGTAEPNPERDGAELQGVIGVVIERPGIFPAISDPASNAGAFTN